MALDGWFLNFAQGSNWIGWEREQTIHCPSISMSSFKNYVLVSAELT